MTNEEFKGWINGYVTLSTEDHIDSRQITIIKNHANFVKTVSSNLDAEIIHFLEMLDREIEQKNCIIFSDFKKYANNLFTPLTRPVGHPLPQPPSATK